MNSFTICQSIDLENTFQHITDQYIIDKDISQLLSN